MTRGYQPDFDFTLEYGQGGEDLTWQVLHMPHKSRIEVKRKTYVDDEFYLEVRHDPGRRGRWAPSGLATTKADWYAFVVADTGVILLVPTELLRSRFPGALG